MISLKVTPVIPHLCAVVSVIQSTLWIVLKITCSRNPLISPLITIPAFALHIGINCGPCELCSLLDWDYCEGTLDICLLGVSAGKRDQIEIFFKKKFLSKIDVDLIIWSRTFVISKKNFLSIWSLFSALTPHDTP